MCEDFASDSSGFDDVGLSDFDSDISSDFDADFSSDIDSMDFDDVETIDFDDDIGSDFGTSDISDDFDSMDFDDIDSIDFDDIGDDFDTDIEAMDFDDDVESLDFDDDIETLDFDDDIETLDIDDDIEYLDIDEDIETIDIDDDIKTLDIGDDIDAIDTDDIETIDMEDDVDVSELSEDIEDMNLEDISEDAFDIEEGFYDSEMDIVEEEADFEAEIAEMEEMTEAMEAEESDFDSKIDSMEFDNEAEAMDMAEEFEDIDATDSNEILEDFDNGIEDIDISEDLEAMDLDEGVEGEDITDTTNDIGMDDSSFDTLEEVAVDSEDVLEDALTDLEADNAETGDMPAYIDIDETNEAPETIDWDSMLSDGDRDYINGIMTNDNYTPEQKDFLVSDILAEIYERETTEPEYGARVKGLTYDGKDIITRPPEDYNSEPYIDQSLLEGALNNENLTSENLSNLRDYLDNISNDESLTDDEKSFLINEALGFASDTNGISQETYANPSAFEGIKEANAPAEVAESINDAPVNEYNEPFSGELSEQDIDTVYEGLNEYDFHGVDCLQDVGRLDSSLENFTSENWENLSLEEQKDQMTDLAQYIIDVTGLENPPTIEFYNSGKDGDYGGFNRATNTLSINEHMLYQNDEAADTVAHELWHAYQYERASNPSTKLDHMYLENFNDYITPDDDFEGYQSQILESEARAFAQQIKDRLHSY